MQIQLKQPEIATALKGYLATQGINLQNKSVTIGFTAGRKEGGLTADISIDDIGGTIPGFTDGTGDDDETPVKPALTVVKSESPAGDTAAEPQPEADDPATTETVKPTTSLFG